MEALHFVEVEKDSKVFFTLRKKEVILRTADWTTKTKGS